MPHRPAVPGALPSVGTINLVRGPHSGEPNMQAMFRYAAIDPRGALNLPRGDAERLSEARNAASSPLVASLGLA
jgi:hypothetical protein